MDLGAWLSSLSFSVEEGEARSKFFDNSWWHSECMISLILIILIGDAIGSNFDGFMTRLSIPKHLVISFDLNLALFILNGQLNGLHAIAKEVTVVNATSADIDGISFPLKFFNAAVQLLIVVVLCAVVAAASHEKNDYAKCKTKPNNGGRYHLEEFMGE
ncbi:hypothetical protein [Burkholderia cenocepacia]|uniref:hypothetical protein n=1 Tax=Burkholderia cenocepacia TaxID=95486 RepID=UPI00163A6B85|nr:hypothetical protein [Burkholderia cenocepacia]